MRAAGFLAVGAAVVVALASFTAPVHAQAADAVTVEASSEEATPVELKGEVVRTAVEAKTLTIKLQPAGEAATEVQLTVEGEGAAALGDLKAGDNVTATCREGTSGDKCVVTSVRKASSAQ